MNNRIDAVLADNTAAHQILFHDGMYAAFGSDPCQDFVRLGSGRGIIESALYEDSSLVSNDSEFCGDLFKQVFDLSDPALLASFRVAPWQIQFMKNAIKSIDATHVILFGDEDGVFFNCFDALRFMPDARMNRAHETKVLTHQLKDAPSKSFHVTLNAASIRRLPATELDVGIGKNDITVFTDDKSGDVFLLRDLDVALPMVNFFSDRLQQYISLSLPASSLFQDQDTSQPDSLESEFDEQDPLNQFVP